MMEEKRTRVKQKKVQIRDREEEVEWTQEAAAWASDIAVTKPIVSMATIKVNRFIPIKAYHLLPPIILKNMTVGIRGQANLSYENGNKLVDLTVSEGVKMVRPQHHRMLTEANWR